MSTCWCSSVFREKLLHCSNPHAHHVGHHKSLCSSFHPNGSGSPSTYETIGCNRWYRFFFLLSETWKGEKKGANSTRALKCTMLLGPEPADSAKPILDLPGCLAAAGGQKENIWLILTKEGSRRAGLTGAEGTEREGDRALPLQTLASTRPRQLGCVGIVVLNDWRPSCDVSATFEARLHRKNVPVRSRRGSRPQVPGVCLTKRRSVVWGGVNCRKAQVLQISPGFAILLVSGFCNDSFEQDVVTRFSLQRLC